jgi:maltose alpha-D-glucosyltransferase/alpha-amylase
VRSLIRAYRECEELGWGTFSLLSCDTPSVLAHQVVWGERSLVVLHNLSGTPVRVTAQLPSQKGPLELHEPLGRRTATADRDGKITVDLARYGSVWLRPDV